MAVVVDLVALTGRGQEEVRRRSREAGSDYHLVEPVDPSEVQGALRGARAPSETVDGAHQMGRVVG